LLQLTDAIAERKLLPAGDAPALPGPPPKPKVYHNLPQPDYGRFVGREAELAQVVRILRPYPHSQHALVTIDGIGGIGKSALALEVAHRYLRNYDRIPPEERFEAIIWTSAKQSVLTAEGTVPRGQALRTLDDIYTTIAVTLEREDITRARPEGQAEVVRNALTRQRTLLIVDNLETVDDEAVMAFLRELPAPTKAMVTTRHRVDVAYPVRLVGMPWEDAQELIAQECTKKGVTLSEDEARRLYDRTGGVPLAIVWSVAQMGFGYDTEAVLRRLGQPSEDISRFCFEGAMERIRGKPAHKLLMALSLFATDASREALGYVANLPELDRDDGLAELEKLSLVNKQGNRFAMLPLTRSFGLHELESNTDFANGVTERRVTQLTGLLQHQTDRYWIRDQEIILREGENFLSLLDWAITRDNHETVFKIIRPSFLYLQDTGRRAEALKLAWHGREFARQYGNKSISAWLCVASGWILSQQGSHRDALEQIEEGLKGYQQLADDAGICFARCLWAQALRHAGKPLEAEKPLKDAIAEASRLEYHEGISIGEFEQGKLARTEHNWEKAYAHFSAARSALSELGDTPTDLFTLAILGNYAVAAFELGKLDEAKEVSKWVLDVLVKWRRRFDLASNFTARMHLQVAEIEEAIENYPEATRHAKEALALSYSTRNKKGIEQAEQFLERLQERLQRTDS
jgi:LuxR family glucitol operon transcriptional activator